MAVDESYKKDEKFRTPDIKIGIKKYKIAVDKWKLLFSCKLTLKVSISHRKVRHDSLFDSFSY